MKYSKAQQTMLVIVVCSLCLVGHLLWEHQDDEATPEASEFDRMVNSIEFVESKCDPWAVGDNGNAVGSFQIWKIYVDDVNRILKLARYPHNVNPKQYGYKDRYVRETSREIVTIYLKHYGGTIEEMARKHNGGPQGHKKKATEKYWLKVKARMDKLGGAK